MDFPPRVTRYENATVFLARPPLRTLNAHNALGHPSRQTMLQLGFSDAPNMIECSSCAAGKSTRTFPKAGYSPKSTVPLQLLHADLCGPISVAGIGLEKYFLTIVDDFSRWTQIVPLEVKSDCNNAVMNFIKTAENHFSGKGYKVSKIRTDNGTEFCNKIMDEFYYEKGIFHQKTVPYNSSQNGVAERKHKTIQEKTRKLIASAGAPIKFWSKAVKTAEFVINRLPSSYLKNKSPFELWNDYSPNYSIFHPFGVQCRVLVPKTKRNSIFDASNS